MILRLARKGSPGASQDISFRLPPQKEMYRGFSLIEYLFALFLTILAVLVMTATLPVATEARARSERHHRALNIAQKQLESVKALGYSQISPSELHRARLVDSPIPDGEGRLWFTHVDSPHFDAPSQVLPEGRGYLVLTPVRLDLIQISVVVEWRERSVTKRVMLSTQMANK